MSPCSQLAPPQLTALYSAQVTVMQRSLMKVAAQLQFFREYLPESAQQGCMQGLGSRASGLLGLNGVNATSMSIHNCESECDSGGDVSELSSSVSRYPALAGLALQASSNPF